VTATALAPPRAASWTVMIPMLPAAPRTSTDSPGAKRGWERAKWAKPVNAHTRRPTHEVSTPIASVAISTCLVGGVRVREVDDGLRR
jgi:hypothetical protein